MIILQDCYRNNLERWVDAAPENIPLENNFKPKNMVREKKLKITAQWNLKLTLCAWRHEGDFFYWENKIIKEDIGRRTAFTEKKIQEENDLYRTGAFFWDL